MRRRPSRGLRHQVEEATAEVADGDAADDGVADLFGDEGGPVAGGFDVLVGGGEGNEDGDGGEHEAVVEAAFDVEGLADADGDARVGDDGLAEGGVSGREDGGDERSFPNAEAGEQEEARPGTGEDGEREADAEQAEGKLGLHAEAGEVDADGVGVEDENEGGFGEDADGAAVDFEVEDVESFGAEEDAGEDEEDRAGEEGRFNAPRYEAVDEGDRRRRSRCFRFPSSSAFCDRSYRR